MSSTLHDIELTVDRLATRINAPKEYLPTYGHTIDGAHPHIEVSEEGKLFFVIVERGQEDSREQAIDKDDLLYKIFRHVTNCMVFYEFEHIRKAAGDYRLAGFKMQEEIIGLLSLKWRERLQKEHENILAHYPIRPNK
jgi:hypothetical protein